YTLCSYVSFNVSLPTQLSTLSLHDALPISGARLEVRGEEWIVRKAEQTSTGATALHVTGLSELVRNKDAIFLTDIDTELRVRKIDRKSTRLNSSHVKISYAVFCLKKKKKTQ